MQVAPAWGWKAAVAGAVAALYLPACFATFGFYDDYNAVYASVADPGTYVRFTTAIGRPLHGLLLEPSFRAAGSVENLGWIRALGMVFSVIAGLAAYTSAVRARTGPAVATFVGIATAAMPSLLMLNTWAVAVWHVAAVAAAITAGLLAASPGRALLRVLAPVGLLVGAFAVYQPGALCFVPAFLVVTLGRLPEDSPGWRDWAWGVGVLAAASGVYVAASLMAMQLVGVTASERSGPPSSVSAKLSWFLEDALPRTLDPLAFQPRPVVGLAVAAMLVAGVWLHTSGSPLRARLAAIGALAAGYLLVCSPVLVVGEDWASARALTAAQVFLVFMSALALRGFGRHVSPTVSVAVMGAGVVAIWGLASLRVNAYIAVPQSTEYLLVRQAILAIPMEPTRPLYVVAAGFHQTLAPSQSLDEFGLPSTSTTVVLDLVRVVLEEEGRPIPDLRLVSRDSVPSGAQSIDFGEVLRQGGAVSP